MNYAYSLTGNSTPLVKRYKISETMATAGVPVLVNAANGAGLALASTTAAADAVGVTVGTGVYSTTQGDAEGTVEVIISPDAVYKLRMANSAVAGTQLVITTNSVAETAGTVVTITTGDPAPNNPEMDEGTIVCVAGNNVGQTRKITSTAATTATVTVPFLNDIAASDVFIIVPWTPADVAGDNIQLTTTLIEARQDIAVGTGIAMVVVDIEFDTSSQDNARRKSYVYGQLDDSIFRDAT